MSMPIIPMTRRDSGFYPYEVENSISVNSVGNSQYLQRTQGVATNSRKWTLSAWLKRVKFFDGTYMQKVLEGNEGGAYQELLSYTTDDTALLYRYYNGYRGNANSNAQYKDFSAWTHVVAQCDSVSATASERFYKMFVNGKELSFASYSAPLNENGGINGNPGAIQTLFSYFYGFAALVHFVDGLCVAPSEFCEYKESIWIPKKYSGGYGAQGYQLLFEDAGNLGVDTSGNNNHFTVVGSPVQSEMTPTSNFASLNSSEPSGCLLELNNTHANTQGRDNGIMADMPLPDTGKWVWEVDPTNYDNYNIFGVTNDQGVVLAADNIDWTKAWYWRDNGTVYNAGVQQTSPSPAVLDSPGIVGMVYDADASTMTLYNNGTLVGTYSVSVTGTLYPFYKSPTSSTSSYPKAYVWFEDLTYDYGDAKRLTHQAIEPDVMPKDGIAAFTYEGNGGEQVVSTGADFKPDFVWVKCINGDYSHISVDSVRGPLRELYFNGGYSETVRPDDGNSAFTGIGEGSITVTGFNMTGNAGLSYLGMALKKGPEYGFNILTWAGNGNTASTILYEHGLGGYPDLVITKKTSATLDWIVQGRVIADVTGTAISTTNMRLNGTQAAVAQNDANMTLSATGLVPKGVWQNASGADYVSYVFKSVPGFSKFTTVMCNGQTDNAYIHLGFRPAVVILKPITAAYGWYTLHKDRYPYNWSGKRLTVLNTNAAESGNSTQSIHFTSNGIKINDASVCFANGVHLLVMAWADQPAAFSNAR